MRRLFLALFFFFTFLNVFSQTPDWDWAKQSQGLGLNEGAPVITDAGENVYISGAFGGDSISFGPFTLHNIFPGTGTTDIFLTKYDSSGNVIWTRGAGGSGNDWGGNMLLDSAGNIYMVGWFSSPSIIFGSDTLFNDSVGSADIFFVKYTITGNVVWAKSYGGKSSDYAGDICSDYSGNIYMVGKFFSPSIIFGSDTLYNNGIGNVLITKFDTAGNTLWATCAIDTTFGSDGGNNLTTDGFGNIYITGTFSSSAISFGAHTLYGTAQDNTFVVKYDSSGTALWAKGANGSNGNQGVYLASDSSANVFVTGIFNTGLITFGSYTLSNSTGSYSPYILKYDGAGNVIWAKAALGWGYSFCLALDARDNIYVTGNMLVGGGGIISFDTVSLFSSGAEPMYIVKYDSSGNAVWGKALDFGGDDANGVTVGRSGNIYIAGDFLISPAIVGNDTMTQLGGETIFVAKLSYPTNPTENISQSETSQSEILLSPNPFSSNLTIHFASPQKSTAYLKIFNSICEVVVEKKIWMQDQTLNLSSLPQGIYLVRIIAGGRTYFQKIVRTSS